MGWCEIRLSAAAKAKLSPSELESYNQMNAYASIAALHGQPVADRWMDKQVQQEESKP